MSRAYLSRGVTRPDNSDIPEGWRVGQLGDLVEVVPGGRLGLTKTDDYRSSGTPAFSAAGQDGFVDVTEFERKGVVLSAIGADCGKCFYASGQWTTLANVQALLPNSQIIAKYLYYRVNQDNYWPRSGSAQPFIKPSAIPKCWLLLPPLPEQRRIVEILGAADEAIRQTERVIAKLREVKEGLLHDLLTRGLDADGNLRDPDAHPEQFKDSPLGKIPKEWEVRTFDEISWKITDGVHATPDYQESGIPFVSVNNLEGNSLSFEGCKFISENDHEALIQRCHPEIGDILMGKVATLGVVDVVRTQEPFSIFVQIALIKLQEGIIPRFVKYSIMHQDIQDQIDRMASGTTMRYIGTGKIAEILVRVPPLHEQSRIANVLKAHDARIRAEEAALEKLRQVKRGLMDDLLTGRVRVKM